MNWLRKIDWYLQITSIVVALCAISYMGIFAVLLGQIVLGSLQIISGVINVFVQLPARFQKVIKRYWVFVFAYFVISAILYFVNKKMQLQTNPVLIIQYMVIPWMIAFYYLFWYKKLINHMEYHRELEGLIKS